jgi:hypothetical protein
MLPSLLFWLPLFSQAATQYNYKHIDIDVAFHASIGIPFDAKGRKKKIELHCCGAASTIVTVD